mmetsp:Transcript_21374/g.60545  ORF Transcript_21374/g.60545 Transcript_21374/m.60545 type:complete len:947 (+) Transcript_21374:133-2973(+)
MECLAGIAAFGGVGAKDVFEYNRDNFLYDRRLRLKKEFKLQEFRIAQAELWREDVRDLISLTEYKMHVYLLVNVLMLGVTVVLYTEGHLPPQTPSWLMMGFVIATAGSFVFLLLSIWMAMQAAVAAQSYETRLLTQLVRLPIPSWQEIEACRTYASEFEHTEPRQMFRVPFVSGRQQDLLRGSATLATPETARAPEPSDSGSDLTDSGSVLSGDSAPVPSVGSGRGVPPSAGTLHDSAAAHSDPWGLERRGDGIYELGCKVGQEVANLRHILLARHAMAHWQTHDAFARVCMSIGVNQLLLAMSYYLIGYVRVQVGCSTSAIFGVVLLTAMAETLAAMDMSLCVEQLRFLQALLLVGPLLSCYAGYCWTRENEESGQISEIPVVVAFFSHSMYLAVMSHFCKIRPQDNGALLPTAFRSVLYLDVFGWLKLPQNDQTPDEHASVAGSNSGVGSALPLDRADGGMTPESQVRRGSLTDLWARTSGLPQDGGTDLGRPALAAVRYIDGRPVPQRPEDMSPSGAVQDMRGLPEAPHPKRVIRETEETEFYRAASWLQEGSGDTETLDSQEGWAGPIVTGHEKKPGILPWVVFSTALRTLCFAWFCAASCRGLWASRIWNGDSPASAWLQSTESSHGLQLGLTAISPHWLGLEAVQVTWPYSDLEPRSLACDASGSNFVVSDGLTLYAAALHASQEPSTFTALRRNSGHKLQMAFQESPCPALAGEGLQDVALMCTHGAGAQDAACEAFVLHEHGRRVASCSVGVATAAKQGVRGLTANISGEWLERFRGNGLVKQADDQEAGFHGRIEKATAITFDSECGAEPALALQNCTILGTNRGRAVRLRRQVQGALLRPVEALRERTGARGAPLRPGSLRALQGGSLGILEANGQSIQVFSGAGSKPLGKLVPPTGSPVAAFCIGGGHLYALGEGPSPHLWRARLPQWLPLRATS